MRMDWRAEKSDLLVTLSVREVMDLSLPNGPTLGDTIPAIVWTSLKRTGELPPNETLPERSGVTLLFRGAAQEGDSSTASGYSLASLTAELFRPGALSLLLFSVGWEGPTVLSCLAREKSQDGTRTLLAFVDHFPPNPPKESPSLVVALPDAPGVPLSVERLGELIRVGEFGRVFVDRLDCLAEAREPGGLGGILQAWEALSFLAEKENLTAVAGVSLSGKGTGTGHLLAGIPVSAAAVELLGHGKTRLRSG